MTDPTTPLDSEGLATFYDLEFNQLPHGEGEVVFGQLPFTLGEYDLVFDSELRDDNHIIFGDAPALGGTIPEIQAALDLPLQSFYLSGFATAYKDLYRLSIRLPLPPLPLTMVGSYDVNTFRGMARGAVQSFSESDFIIEDTRSKLRDSVRVLESFKTRFQEADFVIDTSLMRYQDSYIVKREAVTFFEQAQPVKEFIVTSSQVAEGVSRAKDVSFEAAESLSSHSSKVGFQEGEIVSRQTKTLAESATPVSRRFGFSNYYSQAYNKSFDVFYQNAEFPVNVVTKVVVPPVLPSYPIYRDQYEYDIGFSCLPTVADLDPLDGTIIFNDCWKTKPPSSVDFTEPYFVINSIELINLETGEAIQATSLDFSTDLSSFAWSGSMTVSADEVGKITSPTNNPVKVGLTFNGKPAVFMVQTISKAVSFNKAVYKVELISPTALLDSPYSRIDSRTVTEDIAPQSLIEPMMHTNVTGLVLKWQYLSPLDWVVAANTFTYQELAPVKAIGKLLEGSAAFMYSDLDGSGLTIKRKRQVEFWEEGLNPKVLDMNLLSSLSFAQERHRNFDAVYVISGLNTTLGITAHVVRDAYAGTELAPQIIAPTLTSPSSIRDAGKYRLGTAGIVETRTLSQPIIEGEHLLVPSDLVSFEQDGVSYIGTVLSTSVSLKFNSQYQNFVVEVVKGFA